MKNQYSKNKEELNKYKDYYEINKSEINLLKEENEKFKNELEIKTQQINCLNIKNIEDEKLINDKEKILKKIMNENDNLIKDNKDNEIMKKK